jgi:antitoxin (DNA-binding transcriptional repressor) of toxin-antitoxin stability system
MDRNIRIIARNVAFLRYRGNKRQPWKGLPWAVLVLECCFTTAGGSFIIKEAGIPIARVITPITRIAYCQSRAWINWVARGGKMIELTPIPAEAKPRANPRLVSCHLATVESMQTNGADIPIPIPPPVIK